MAKFKDNGKLKLLIIVGTASILIRFWHILVRIMTTT